MKKLVKMVVVLALVGCALMACVTAEAGGDRLGWGDENDRSVYFYGSNQVYMDLPLHFSGWYIGYWPSGGINIYYNPISWDSDTIYCNEGFRVTKSLNGQELAQMLVQKEKAYDPDINITGNYGTTKTGYPFAYGNYTKLTDFGNVHIHIYYFYYNYCVYELILRDYTDHDDDTALYANMAQYFNVVVPKTPSFTKAAQVGKSGVKLYFTPEANTKYSVYRSTNPNSGFIWTSNLTNPTGKDTVYVATAGMTYYYKLRPYTEQGGTRIYGNYSNTVSCAFLTAPTITKVENYSTNAAKVTLTGVSGATGYALYQKKQGVGDLVWKQTVTGNTAYAYSLEPGSTVWFQVRGIVDQPDGTRGVGLASPAKSVIIPGVPKNLKGTWTATGTTGTASLSWSRVWNISGYEVYTSTSANGTYKLAGRTTSTSMKVANLPRKTTTYFKVRCYVQLADGTKAYGSYSNPVYAAIR